jgi:competence protein ComEC
VLLRYKDFSVLLTGDSQVNGLEDALRDISLQKISVLHVPHHGSKTGLNKKLIDHLQPQLAVISVGKNNYGHPSQEILNLLRANSIEIRETIKQGKIEIVSDGDRWILKK